MRPGFAGDHPGARARPLLIQEGPRGSLGVLHEWQSKCFKSLTVRHSQGTPGMAYDATKMADWEISEAAERSLPPPAQWRERLGLQQDEVIPMGRLAKLDFLKIIERLSHRPDGKYIEVTAITPTPLGEGKSTTSFFKRLFSGEYGTSRLPSCVRLVS